MFLWTSWCSTQNEQKCLESFLSKKKVYESHFFLTNRKIKKKLEKLIEPREPLRELVNQFEITFRFQKPRDT